MSEPDVRTDTSAEGSTPSLGFPDPALLGRIAAVLKETGVVTSTTSGTSPSPTGDGLASVLSNPQLMEKLPQMMAALSPMLSSPQPPPPPPAGTSAANERETLLCALRPFLSPERQHALDSILRIQQLGLILGRMQDRR